MVGGGGGVPHVCGWQWLEGVVPHFCGWRWLGQWYHISVAGGGWGEGAGINPFTPRVNSVWRRTVVLTFESVDKILWCDNSNKTSSVVVLHGTVCFSLFYLMKFGVFDFWHSW